MTHVALSSLLVIRLNVAIAERLKSLGLFDVMALPLELAPLYRLRTRPADFLRVVHVMLAQASDNSSLSFEQFSALITDDEAFSQLWEAFTREVTDFFRAAMRPAIAEVFRMLEMAEAQRVSALTETIQLSQSQIEANSAGDSSGEPPELPELIPELSHCDSLTIWPPAADETNGLDTRGSVPSPPTVTADETNPLSMPTISIPTETRPES